MPNFDTYIMRHSESWVQEIIEQIERAQGIHPADAKSLEQRWTFLMTQPAMQPHAVAA